VGEVIEIFPPDLPSSRPNRRLRALRGLEVVSAVFPPIVPGVSVFGITGGQYSLVDILAHILRELGGGASVSVWSLVVGDFEARCMQHFAALGLIQPNARLIFDRSSEQRAPALADQWRAVFGPDSVRVVFNHSKMVAISGGGLRLLLRGSMNLNENPRFEQFEVSEGGPEFDVVQRIESGLPILPALSSNSQATRATGASVRLSDFPFGDGIKTWTTKPTAPR
jgi:hypothetical protein